MTPPATWTSIVWVELRSVGMAVDVRPLYVSPPPDTAMPMKLFDGSPVFWDVSNVTATPGMPAAPRAPPLPPTEVGRAPAVGLPSTKAAPSAPLPWSMVMSKTAWRLAVATAVGQKAEPDAAARLGVMMSELAVSEAWPLTCHPPAHGAGTT